MTTTGIADLYYDAFRQQTDFGEVPFAEKLTFRGPNGTIDGAAPFRSVVAGLAQGVRSLDVRHRLAHGDTVVTVYDFDLGLPDGAIPMAEVLRIEDEEITAIELLFDARRLGAGAS